MRGTGSGAGALPDLRFPGQWFQAESGLHQNWMRDYDPALGRYLQADPLGLVDGASVYGYALQNPGRYVDPRGLFGTDPTALARNMFSFGTGAGSYFRGAARCVSECTPETTAIAQAALRQLGTNSAFRSCVAAAIKKYSDIDPFFLAGRAYAGLAASMSIAGSSSRPLSAVVGGGVGLSAAAGDAAHSVNSAKSSLGLSGADLTSSAAIGMILGGIDKIPESALCECARQLEDD